MRTRHTLFATVLVAAATAAPTYAQSCGGAAEHRCGGLSDGRPACLLLASLIDTPQPATPRQDRHEDNVQLACNAPPRCGAGQRTCRLQASGGCVTWDCC